MFREGIDFEDFIGEVSRRKQPVQWHMTWLLSQYVEHDREGGSRAQRLIWNLLKHCENDSMKRDLWRAFTFIDVTEDIAGEIFDTAMAVIPSSNQPIALRAHAMFAARNIALPYAELRDELCIVLETLSMEESPAIRARSKNLIRELRKRQAKPNERQ